MLVSLLALCSSAFAQSSYSAGRMADLAWNDDLGFYVAVWQEAVPPPSGQVDGELWVDRVEADGRGHGGTELTAGGPNVSGHLTGRWPRIVAAGSGFVVLIERETSSGAEIGAQYFEWDEGPIGVDDPSGHPPAVANRGDLVSVGTSNFVTTPGRFARGTELAASLAFDGEETLLVVWQDDDVSNFGRRQRLVMGRFLRLDRDRHPYLFSVGDPFVINPETTIPSAPSPAYRFGTGPSVAAGVSLEQSFPMHFVVSWISYVLTPPDPAEGIFQPVFEQTQVVSRAVRRAASPGLGPLTIVANEPVDGEEGPAEYIRTTTSRAWVDNFAQDYTVSWIRLGSSQPQGQVTCLELASIGGQAELRPDVTPSGRTADVQTFNADTGILDNTFRVSSGAQAAATTLLWGESTGSLSWANLSHHDCRIGTTHSVSGLQSGPLYPRHRGGFAGPGNPFLALRTGLNSLPQGFVAGWLVETNALAPDGPGWFDPSVGPAWPNVQGVSLLP